MRRRRLAMLRRWSLGGGGEMRAAGSWIRLLGIGRKEIVEREI